MRIKTYSFLFFLFFLLQCKIKSGFDRQLACITVSKAIHFSRLKEEQMFRKQLSRKYQEGNTNSNINNNYKLLGDTNNIVSEKNKWEILEQGVSSSIVNLKVIRVPFYTKNLRDTMYIDFTFDGDNKYVKNDKILSIDQALINFKINLSQ